MIMMYFRMFVWLVLCAVVYAGYPTLAPPWVFAILAIAGLLALYRISPKPEKVNWVVVDGSNVMHWIDETPSLVTVAAILEELLRLGFQPLVWFDANVGYKVGDRFMGEAALARHLPVGARAIRVSPKGSPADPLLIADALHLKGRVVSNDKFRDWTEQFPQLLDEAFLIRGEVRGNGVMLRVGGMAEAE